MLDAGADPVKVHNGKGSLLELAVQQDDPAITRMLLPKYLPISDKDKQELLRVLMQYGKPSSVKVLTENGIKITADKDPLMMITAVEGLNRAIAEDKMDKVQALLDQGIDINASGYGQSPLTIAIYYKNKRMIEFLLEKGADVNLADKYGTTPLGAAIGQKDLEIYAILLSKKADPVFYDPAHPYLILAVQNYASLGLAEKTDGAFDILESLIKAGNPVDQTDAQGVTPLWQLAVYRPYNAAAEGEFIKAVQILLAHGAKVDAVSTQCKPMPAVVQPSKNEPAVAQQNNADVKRCIAVDPQMMNNYLCRTPLINAVSSGSNAVARALIEAGANVNWHSPDGRTPLMQAALSGDPKTVALLLSKGADPKLRDAANKTAADLARDAGNTKALSDLEKY